MAEECKYLIVGRFIRVRPQIEKIRSTFAEKIPLKGNAKIGIYDLHNIFIVLYNEEDYNTVRFRRRIEVDGKEMWLTKWTPNWKPKEDAPYAPVWVLLPKLPMNCHKWDYIKQILAPVGILLAIDTTTRGRTRPSMAKVRVKIDLLKPQLEQVWVGLEDDNTGFKGFAQKIEYEAVPKYCKHCRLLGHSVVQCRFLEKKKQAETNKVTEEEHVVVEKDALQKEGSKHKEDNIAQKEVSKPIEEQRAQVQETQIKIANINDQIAATHAGTSKKAIKDKEKRRKRRQRNALKIVKQKKNSKRSNQQKLAEGASKAPGTSNTQNYGKLENHMVESEQDEHIEKEHLQVTQNDHNVNSTGQVPLQQGTLTIEATDNTLGQREIQQTKPILIIPMISTIIWNIRGVESKGAFDRLIKLKKGTKLALLLYKSLSYIIHSWRIIKGSCECMELWQTSMERSVYAKSKSRRRKKLWESLEQMNSQFQGPWSIFGDFNCIVNATEKEGGRPPRLRKSLDFINCMNGCGMLDAGYSSNNFTWTNNRRKMKKIRERLDRVFYYDEWSATFPLINVRHLPRTCSDHNMLLMTCSIEDVPPIKYFKFLSFWTEQKDFQKIVKDSWDEEVIGNPMWIIQQKLKRLANSLSYWSRNTIGNVFDKTKELEEKIEAMEAT
ncbi:uncharacterized protein [Nicotiana tomentosiformis]|uniref:uncharacterized protein n=1 Tax=Nicotiana tomentosiformis TaxID=4098 RepID=UPI00388CC16E